MLIAKTRHILRSLWLSPATWFVIVVLHAHVTGSKLMNRRKQRTRQLIARPAQR
jgi:hypothetical protein